MQINTDPKAVKFGDIQISDKIWYIDPILREIEPAFVIMNTPLSSRQNCQIECILVPKEYRNKPINELPTSVVRKIVFAVDRQLTMALVATRPPTIYCTTQSELRTWLKLRQ